jgi:pimeloyl-ACP methyl ester carboxylesterase
MDLPGFGLTGPDVSHRYEVKDDVKFLSAFMDKLGISRAHLVGSSLGGRIAWQYALDFPDQVMSLTLINALGYPQAQWPPAIEMGQWPVVDKIMAHVSPRFMYEIGLKEVYFNKALVSDQLVDRYFELSRYPGNMAAFPSRVKVSLDQDSLSISHINVPTLILWGEQDLYFPVARAYEFKKDISGAQLYIYPEVGHLPMEEVPQKSMKHFDEFITGLVTLDLAVSSNP